MTLPSEMAGSGRALETCLLGVVAPAVDAVRADPSRARPIDEVRAGLAAARTR